MMTFIRQLITPVTNQDLLTQLRVVYIRALSIGGIIIAGVGLVSQFFYQSGPRAFISTFLVLVLSSLLLVLVQRRLILLASYILVGMFTVAAVATPLPVTLLMSALALISGAALLSTSAFIGLNCIIFARMTIHVVTSIQTSGGPMNPQLMTAFVGILLLLIVSTTTRFFIERTQKAVETSLRNTILLQASAEIGQELSSLLDIRQVFSRSVDLIRDRFGYYHVQVFMVDAAGEQAELVASTGDVGQKLLAQRHKLAVGSGSVIGRVTRFGEPVIARANQRNTIHRPNPLLPHTKSELAIPILDGEKIIGALDVQSMLANAFQAEDVQALQTVANLLATSIRNARLFEAQNRSVQEQQRLFLESEANLREIQRLNQQLTRAGWVDYVRDPSSVRGVTLRENRVVPDTDWTDTLIEASQAHRPVVREANGKPAVVAVPVLLRGEVIGAIEVEPGTDSGQASTVEMVEAVAQRLAISLDNARLFEEAQAATAQEQRINSIVTRYQEATTVDELLRITLTELSQSLGAQQGAIRLGRVQEESAHD